MKILLIRRGGRTHRRRGGGIIRSGDMITNTLESFGVRVLPHTDATPVTAIPEGTDLVWVYGDDQHLEETIQTARAASIPVLINSVYDGTGERARVILQRMAQWDPDNRGDLFMGVFAPEAEFTPDFETIRDQMVTIPKTIRAFEGDIKPFEEREGICIGDLAKTFRGRLNGGFDVRGVIETLLADGYPVTAYMQYGTGTEYPEGLRVVPNERDEDKFFEFLGGFRLHALLTPYCTFEMVPIEAQSCGTVVLYPYMRQSLSQYIGHTGVMYRNEEELLDTIRALYDNEDMWTPWSRSGVLNAQAHSIGLLGPALVRSLHGVVQRYKGKQGKV